MFHIYYALLTFHRHIKGLETTEMASHYHHVIYIYRFEMAFSLEKVTLAFCGLMSYLTASMKGLLYPVRSWTAGKGEEGEKFIGISREGERMIKYLSCLKGLTTDCRRVV